MKYIIVVLIGLTVLSCGNAKIDQSTVLNPTNNPKGVQGSVSQGAENVPTAVNTIQSKTGVATSSDDIEKTMVFLTSDELQGRDTGSEGIGKAASFIEDVFEENNVAPYYSTYKDTLSNYSDGIAYNIVGVVPGTDPALKNEYVIIGAHYDHIGLINAVAADNIANGANDNASGTTAVIEFAKYFGGINNNKRSILFALFSAEEKGLLGSKHLAQKLKQENLNVYVMLNFEMIGVPMLNKDHDLYLTGYEQSNLAEISNVHAGKNFVGFLPKAKEFNLFRRSDNAPFHDEFNVPSQTYSSFDFTNFGEYHKVGDEAHLMDFEHMSSIINDAKPMLEGIINAPIKEVKYE
ncbi:Peptidase family M28 [Maribacter sedimenticola]|uniref:Peptidase family M28 n=1 Tax=Maribacter sedimenticola TaxID=228956 RepID=A0ABY1SN02_9FLAO|nr:M28 family peptidase [Maribacter sedimenticola]SNR81310.1 Peptidase family M28 [Maribacter sedimenticola]